MDEKEHNAKKVFEEVGREFARFLLTEEVDEARSKTAWCTLAELRKAMAD